MTGNEENGDDGELEISPSKLAIKFAKPVITYVWHWLRGYNLVLLGPSLAGKTRFLRFLYTLEFVPDHKNEYARAADRTLKERKEGLVVLKIGVGNRVELPLRAVVDEPGMAEGEDHANLIVDSKRFASGAHVIVIVLDASQQEESLKWIGDFGKRLTQIITNAPGLREIFVLLNKYDKCQNYDAVNREVADRLYEELKPAIGEKGKTIKIRPTILIKNNKAVELINVVFQDLAFTLRKPNDEKTFYKAEVPE
ncbi:MAG: hypothetical protein GKS05_04750 [Nitrospirales bacterium]|nr:hypothetical protein [Nitrospirales bacterium]